MKRTEFPTVEPRPWAKHAACDPRNNGGRDMSHLFFPTTTVGRADPEAIGICERCPTIKECRTFADGLGMKREVGVWGGVDRGINAAMQQRDKMRRYREGING